MLAGVVLASGLLRLSEGDWFVIGSVFSVASEAHADEHQAAEPDLGLALRAIQEREAELAERAARLEARESRLGDAEMRVGAQLREIEAGEAELRRLLDIADAGAEDDVARLAAVYEAMKPADAGALFEEMPPSFAAGFLSRMSPPASAAILAALPPEAAYAISVTIAGRHADIPPGPLSASAETEQRP